MRKVCKIFMDPSKIRWIVQICGDKPTIKQIHEDIIDWSFVPYINSKKC